MGISPQSVPMACKLDAPGLRAQVDRYRAVGRHAEGVRRSPRRLEVRFGREVDTALLIEAVEVERECCPFFDLSYDPGARELTVTVADGRHDAALDALRFALSAT